jgi:membrane peptidoglycan carboxypeptidase
VKPVAMLAALSAGAGLLTAAAVLPVAGAVGVAAGAAATTFNDLPVAGLGQVPSRSVLLDTSGQPIAYYYPGPVINGQPDPIYRVPVPYVAIAPVMRDAIVAIEDYRFWQHGALDLHGTIRALTTTLSGSGTQGGSDIAQQYVKNACELKATSLAAFNACSAETVARKIKELRIAANVERVMTRPELLAAYLNVAYFDHQTRGIYVAAQYYFSEKPRQLTLPQAALLAGIVQDPSKYDPVANPGPALTRRAQVLNAMVQHGYISQAAADRANQAPLVLNRSPIPLGGGCISPVQQDAAFFCDYVLSVMKQDPQYANAYSELTTVGGLSIYTTMNPQDQRAAEHAVNYMVPPPPSYYNPGGNAAAEVLMQPGTGYVRAIAVDRPYGFGPGQDSVDYAVDEKYNGGVGVQTGSSSKIFTLLTALKQGIPYGFHLKIHSGMTVSGFTNCAGQFLQPFQVFNAEPGGGNIPLYLGTTASINAFYVSLEAHVGLCNVVKTAISLGLHRGDGKSLLSWVGKPSNPNSLPPADDLASFTLGSVNVSPMSMAAAYATVAARGVYCHPIAITKITDVKGRSLPVESASCHRVLSRAVADAATYVFEGVFQAGTATGDGLPGRPVAGKTGTANKAYYVAFAGYTPRLLGYVSMFNPQDPIRFPMQGTNSCYRLAPFNGGSLYCPGFLFGHDAGQIWQYTFERAYLGPVQQFPPPPGFVFSQGPGTQPTAPPKKKHGGHGGGGGGGHGHP